MSIADAAGVWVFRFEYYYCCWRRRAGDSHDLVVDIVGGGSGVARGASTVAANMNGDAFP